MKTTGPNHWTRPPASQRQRWDADIPLMTDEDRYPFWAQVSIWAAVIAVGALFWVAAFAWCLS